MSSKIMELVREAYNMYPFYNWLYSKLKVDLSSATYDDLPFVTKQDLFEYDSSMPESWQVVPPFDFYANVYTSGSSGQALRVLWTMDEFLDLHVKWLTEPIRMWLGDEQPVGICPGPVGPPVSLILQFTCEGKQIVIPREKVFDNDFLYGVIEKGKANVLVDLTGYWVKHLLDSGFPLRRIGIKLIFTVGAISDEILQRLKNEFTSNPVISCYVSTETGLLAHSCPYSTRLHLRENIGARERIIHIADENNKVKEVGEGKLMVTMKRKSLPWVKYWNGDIVTIEQGECECGFRGRFVTSITRVRELKIGGPSGPLVDPSQAEHSLRTLLPSANYLMIYVKGGTEKRKGQLLFVTFIESNVEEPTLDREASIRLMRDSGGVVDHGYVDFFPVVRVKPGSIPFDHILTKQRKSGFLNFVHKPVPDELRLLLKTLESLGYAIEA